MTADLGKEITTPMLMFASPQSLDFGKVGPGFGGDQDVAHPPRKEVWVDADIG